MNNRPDINGFLRNSPLDRVVHLASKSSLNAHELTNQYRRLAREVGKPANPEQQTADEWLADYEGAEVFS